MPTHFFQDSSEILGSNHHVVFHKTAIKNDGISKENSEFWTNFGPFVWAQIHIFFGGGVQIAKKSVYDPKTPCSTIPATSVPNLKLILIPVHIA